MILKPQIGLRQLSQRLNWFIDDLLPLLPGPMTRATTVLILTGITGLAFALSAFACDRLGHKLIAPFSRIRGLAVRRVWCSDLVLAVS